LRKVEGFELLTESAVSTGAGFLDFGDLRVHFFERLADGFYESFNGLLALLEIARGLLLELSEGLFGLLEEIGAVDAEGIGRERFELVRETVVRGAFGVELSRKLRVEGRKPEGFNAEAGELSGELGVFLFAGAQAFAEGGLARAEKEPQERRGQGGGEEGDAD